MNIITLKLNKEGKLALKSETKILYTEAEKQLICPEFINSLFPLSLVESWDIKKSFLGYGKGKVLAIVFADGEKVLGEVSHDEYNKVFVRFCNDKYGGYSHGLYFHPDGTEVTHCKAKAHLEIISDEEAEKMRTIINNESIIEFLELLKEGGAQIEYNAEHLELPEWLQLNDFNNIKQTLLDIKNEFYGC